MLVVGDNSQKLAQQSCKRAQCVVSWLLSFRAGYPQKSPIYYHTKALNLCKFKIIFPLDSAFRSLYMVHCIWYTVNDTLYMVQFVLSWSLRVSSAREGSSWLSHVFDNSESLQRAATPCNTLHTSNARCGLPLQHSAAHCTLQMRGVGYLCELEQLFQLYSTIVTTSIFKSQRFNQFCAQQFFENLTCAQQYCVMKI